MQLFREHSDILLRWQAQLRWLLVDEYQDTNRLQYRIVRALASMHKNITVVGDEDQSIYSWRGADIRNILEFERDFPGASILRLEENYRSTQAILDAAAGLVVRNENRIGKTLRAMRPGGRHVENLVARDEYDEALKVAADIQRNGEGLRIACLYRMNAQSRALEEALAGTRIRYQIVGAVGFYARREIRDILSYLRLTLNPDDDSAFRRVVNVPPRGVGEQTLASITLAAQRRGGSLWAGLKDVLSSEGLPARTRAARVGKRAVSTATHGNVIVDVDQSSREALREKAGHEQRDVAETLQRAQAVFARRRLARFGQHQRQGLELRPAWGAIEQSLRAREHLLGQLAQVGQLVVLQERFEPACHHFVGAAARLQVAQHPVSYTHLTLPASDLV